MANQSIKNAFERFWQHVIAKINEKANTSDLTSHIENKENPHELTAAQIGADTLGSADNALMEAKEYIDTVIDTSMPILPIEKITDYGAEVSITDAFPNTRRITFNASMNNPNDKIFVLKYNNDSASNNAITFYFMSSDSSSKILKMINYYGSNEYFYIANSNIQKSIIINCINSNTMYEIVYDDNGDFVSFYEKKNIYNDNIVTELNKALSSASYSPTVDTDLVTKQYVDLSIPTIPEWAQQETKPEYTAEEVGAATENHIHSYNDLTDVPNISEQIQADWNQNDENAPDYVKDRTHYEEVIEEILLPETTFDFATSRFSAQFTKELVVGETLQFTIDGVVYNCEVVQRTTSILELTNFTNIDGAISTIPFAIQILTNRQMINVNSNNGLVCTFSLSRMKNIVHKIDEKYLPEQVQADWNQNDENAPDYINGRTHYEEVVEGSVIGMEFTVPFSNTDLLNTAGDYDEHNLNIPLQLGQSWSCIPIQNGNETTPIELEVKQDERGILYLGDANPKSDPNYSWRVDANSSVAQNAYVFSARFYAIKIIGVSGTYIKTTIHQLDEKFIPDTIARTPNLNFAVHITETASGGGTYTYYADKTFNEINAAYENGQYIYAVCDGDIIPLDYRNSINSFIFHKINRDKISISFDILSNNTILHFDEWLFTETDYSDLNTTDKTIVGAINELNAKHTEGTDSIILLSPNGTKFNITIGDDGVLNSTEIEEINE